MKIDEPSKNLSQGVNLKKRRNQQSHRAILDSTLLILAERGYQALTIDGVAARAKVSKQTIYRWWPSKAAIVLEAMTTLTQEQLPLPDTGSLREDLLILLNASLNELNQRSGAIVRGLMAEAQLDPDFGRTFREDFITSRRQVVYEILQRGQQRGEISEQIDFELTIDLFYGPIWYRLLNQHAPLDESFAQHLLTQLWASMH